MNNPWILSLIIILFCEGLMLGINPELWQRTMRQMTNLPPTNLRKIGLSMISVAFILLILIYWRHA